MRDDQIFVADAGNRRIARFAVDGDYVDAVGPFLIPSPYFDCVIDAQGRLCASNTGRHRLERYDANGKHVGSWGEFGLSAEKFCGCCNPTNIALFADGRTVTAEKGIVRLKVYDAKGRLLAHLGGEALPAKAAGMALALDSGGRIAALDPVNGRVDFYRLRRAKEEAASS